MDLMRQRKPDWLRAKLSQGSGHHEVRELLEGENLHTVCHSARCPNQGECWARGTATLMILGNICTRACTFCNIDTGRPKEVDLGEPARAARAVERMQLKHAVITSVARDDLPDGGANAWANTIRAIRNKNPQTTIEVLIPDFRGNMDLLDIVLEAKPDILNHNMETVERLQRPVRKTANKAHTLKVLEHAKAKGFITKSGLMLGIGEAKDEVEAILRDLQAAGVEIITIGQYLQPTPKHAPIDRWVEPAEFDYWKQWGLDLGFRIVESGPLVRSSYHADEQAALVRS
ncbi:MAG: lipoyl synthase [Opitutales bacterium]|nr:lipoyl synthase [Opitutales bacterium]